MWKFWVPSVSRPLENWYRPRYVGIPHWLVANFNGIKTAKWTLSDAKKNPSPKRYSNPKCFFLNPFFGQRNHPDQSSPSSSRHRTVPDLHENRKIAELLGASKAQNPRPRGILGHFGSCPLGCPGTPSAGINGERISGLFHLLINGGWIGEL